MNSMTKYVAIVVTMCGAFHIARAVPQLPSDGGVGDVSASAQLMFWDRGVASSIANNSSAAAGQVLGWSANPNAVAAIPGGFAGFSGGGGGGGGGAPAGGGSFGISTAGVASQGAAGTGGIGSLGTSRNLSVLPTQVIKYSPVTIAQNIDGSVPEGGSSLVMLGAALSALGLWAYRKNRLA